MTVFRLPMSSSPPPDSLSENEDGWASLSEPEDVKTKPESKDDETVDETSAAAQTRPFCHMLPDQIKTVKDECRAAHKTSMANLMWVKTLLNFFEGQRRGLGPQVSKVCLGSGCSGMWSEGMVAEARFACSNSYTLSIRFLIPGPRIREDNN